MDIETEIKEINQQYGIFGKSEGPFLMEKTEEGGIFFNYGTKRKNPQAHGS